jgi:hypothetical protein
MPDEHDLREVPVDVAGDGERIQESAVEVAGVIGAAASVAALGVGGVQAYYSRASYELQRQEAAARAAERTEYIELQRELHEMRRIQAYELGGIEALDEFDEWHFDGPFTGLDP